jgi:hypothetical protein
MADLITFDERSARLLKQAAYEELRAPINSEIDNHLPPVSGGNPSHGIVNIKNESGAARNRGDIVALGTATSYTATSAFRRFTGPFQYDSLISSAAINISTTPAQISRFAVLLHSCGINKPAKALVAGYLPIKVNVTSTVHRFARPTTGDYTTLTSDWWGGAEFLSTVAGTGSQYVYCRIGTLAPVIYRGKTDSSHAKGATGTVSVWSGVGSGKSDSGADISDVYNPFAAVGSGKFVDVAWVDGGPELIAAEC